MAALEYADNEREETERRFIDAYDRVKDFKGNKWKLSMGLFWIRPRFFLNLDSRNRWYLGIAENIPETFAKKIAELRGIPAGKEYTRLCKECREIVGADERYHDLVGLSSAAWVVSEEANQKEKSEKETDSSNAAIGDSDVRPTHFWLYAPGEGACKWEEFYAKGVMGIGWREIGDYRQYTSRTDMIEAMRTVFDEPESSFRNASLATWQFLHEIQIGDVIIAKQGIRKIIGRGIVESEYYFEQNDNENDYTSFRKVRWTNFGEWEHPLGSSTVKTLTDVTQYTEYVKNLEELFADDEAELTVRQYPQYDEADFLTDVYMSYENYRDLVTLLNNKKNVILQGAPGVGKTYAAKRLAYSIMGEKNQDRVMMVQFHQSYSYEDFVMGFRPNASGFELKHGAFYEFCKKAQDDDEKNPYFFIIDEINRGNLSKIFANCLF